MKIQGLFSPIILAVATVMTTASSAQDTQGLTKQYAKVDPNKPVICLKPGRVRKLGGRMVYQERRRPEQMLASECEIKGGEYTLYDRANSETALSLWMDLAKQGDAQAQVYVGEIYEKGWVGEPDYAEAYRWYRQAAEQGNHQAERRLAFFYEQGLGVESDLQVAMNLWRESMELEEELVPVSEVELARRESQTKIDHLLAQLEDQNLSTARLQKALTQKESALIENSRKLAASESSITALQTNISSARSGNGNPEELAKLERQLQDRESHIDSLRSTIDLLQTDVDSRSAQLASSIKRAELKGRELTKARQRIEEQSQQTEQIVAQLNTQNSKVAALEKDLQNARDTLLNSKNREADLSRQVSSNAQLQGTSKETSAALQQQLTTAEQEVASAEQEIAGLLSELQSERARFESEMARAEKQQQRSEAQVAAGAKERQALTRKLEQAEQQSQQLAGKLGGAEDAIARAESDAILLEQRLGTIKQGDTAELKRLQAELDSTQQTIAKLESSRQDVESQWQKTLAERDTLRGQLNSERNRFEAELGAAQAREQQSAAVSASEKAALQKELTKVEEQSRQLFGKLDSAQDALARAEGDAVTLEQRLASIKQTETAEIKRLEAELAAKQKAIANLDASKNGVASQWKSVAAERDALRGQLQSETEQRDWLEIELETTRSRLNAATADIRKLDTALQQAQFEKRKLHGDIERLEQDLSTSKSRSTADIRIIERELAEARKQLAGIDSDTSSLQRQRNHARLEEEFIRDQQQSQLLSYRGERRKVEALPPPPSGKAGPYRAVIIANHDYSFLPDLGTPHRDAVRLKRVLEEKYGFQVEVETNLNREEMFKTLNRVRNFSDKEFVLLYYAGHGKMDDFGDGYWLPTDYSEDDPLSDAISNTDITQTLSQSPAKHLMLVADSCYSGALLRKGNPMASVSVPSLMKFWLENKSRTALTSGGLQPVLDTGPDNNSVFASALLSVLAANKGALNGEMLHAAMHDEVVEEAARLGYMDQKPQFAAIDDAGHENGQFVFTPKI